MLPNPRKEEISKKIIRAVVDIANSDAAKPKKRGNVTTYGVIAYMEDAIKYLEYYAFRKNPEDYL